jgi:hypothetical protein
VSEAAAKPVSFYLAFLRCGGSVTLAEFSSLRAEDVIRFNEAASKIEAERAGRVAEAILLRQQEAATPSRGEILERAAREAVIGG